MQDLSLFDFLDNAVNYKPVKSNDWKWSMMNDYPNKNGLKVFSCFACAGGSTMGYKLAGCDVLGCVEIDKKMNDVYIKNHNPKYNYLMDIRDFNKLKYLPDDLFCLDILDGSPPCTTFSIAGDREASWGKIKKFREGKVEQTLDDTCLADVIFREYQTRSRFNESIVWDNTICPTIHHHGFYRGNDKTKFTIEDYRNCSTFPFDFDWCGCSPAYICGMSVPPVMIKRIVFRLIQSGIFNSY